MPSTRQGQVPFYASTRRLLSPLLQMREEDTVVTYWPDSNPDQALPGQPYSATPLNYVGRSLLDSATQLTEMFHLIFKQRLGVSYYLSIYN